MPNVSMNPNKYSKATFHRDFVVCDCGRRAERNAIKMDQLTRTCPLCREESAEIVAAFDLITS